MPGQRGDCDSRHSQSSQELHTPPVQLGVGEGGGIEISRDKITIIRIMGLIDEALIVLINLPRSARPVTV